MTEFQNKMQWLLTKMNPYALAKELGWRYGEEDKVNVNRVKRIADGATPDAYEGPEIEKVYESVKRETYLQTVSSDHS